MGYSDLTICDPNPFKRFLQRKRLEDALSYLPDISSTLEILDFGAGDGELARLLIASPVACRVTCYEPSGEMLLEARAKLANLTQPVLLTGSFEEISHKRFDAVFALEVFEHLPSPECDAALDRIISVLGPSGRAIIGVPNELHFAAIYKGAFRMFRRHGAFDARAHNILKCVLGEPPIERPVVEIAPGLSYFPYHLGFDYRLLGAMLRKRFHRVETARSPFALAPRAISPEIYFIAGAPRTRRLER
jgi:SAM-dependent methyltransferase